MGDRANFGFRQNGSILFLYGHWAGEGMLSRLANALDKARPRWDDETYAIRIATSQMIADHWADETGWGFSINEILDNEHKIPVVDFANKTVSLYEEGRSRQVQGREIFSMDLDTFVKRYKK